MRADVFDTESVAARAARTPRIARYELDVIGGGVADVVGCAGGWLFDRVMAGWDVAVAVPDQHDTTPLRILGVRTVELEALLGNRPPTRALAVCGALCNADDRVRALVAGALRSARTEVTVWGDAWIPALGSRGAAVRHELSSAARVFKAQAAVVAGTELAAIDADEVFFSHGRAARTDYPDLLPAG